MSYARVTVVCPRARTSLLWLPGRSRSRPPVSRVAFAWPSHGHTGFIPAEPRNAGRYGKNSHGKDTCRPPRRGGTRTGRGDRHRDRPGAHAGHYGHHGLAAVRGTRPERGPDRGRRTVLRPPDLPVRLQEHGRPPISAVCGGHLRRTLLSAGQRHLSPGPQGELRGARQDDARLGLTHADTGRTRGVRHRLWRDRRRRRDGRGAVLLRDARDSRGAPGRRVAGVGHREGRYPRVTPSAVGERRRRQGVRVRRPRRGDAVGARADDDHQHGHRTRGDDLSVPDRRAHP